MPRKTIVGSILVPPIPWMEAEQEEPLTKEQVEMLVECECEDCREPCPCCVDGECDGSCAA